MLRKTRHRWSVFAAAVLAVSLALVAHAQQELQSPRLVPADVAFYVCGANAAELWQKFQSSRAFSRLAELKSVEVLQKFVMEDLMSTGGRPELEALEEQLENPLVQDALAVLADMHSHEFFVAADEGFSRMIKLYRRLDRARTWASFIQSLLQGQQELDEEEMEELAEEDVSAGDFELLQEYVAEKGFRIEIPRVLMGWRVADVERARAVVDMSRGLIAMAALGVPELAGRVQAENIAGGDFTVIRLAGDLIPWKELLLPLTEEEEIPDGGPPDFTDVVSRSADQNIGQYLALFVDQLQENQLCLAFGMRDDWILLYLGPDFQMLEIPEEENCLAARKEFAELTRRADEQKIFVGYRSGAFREALGSERDNYRSVAEFAGKWLAHQSALSPTLREQWTKDFEELAGWIGKLERNYGPFANAVCVTARGIEEVALWWEPAFRYPAPVLQSLQLVGPDPVLVVAFAGSSQRDTELVYDFACWAVQTGWSYLERVVENFDEPHAPQIRNFMNRVWLLGNDADRILRQYIIPGVGDGDLTWVVDAKATINRGLDGQQPEKPLPLPEGALVIPIRDRNRLEEGLRQARALFQQFLEIYQDCFPEDWEETKQLFTGGPEIVVEEHPWGYLCRWPVAPPEVTSGFQPTFALSDKVLVLSTSSEQALRIVNGQPINAGGLIRDVDKPRLAAGFVNFDRLWAVIEPWIEAAARASLSEPNTLPARSRDYAEAIQAELETIGKIFRCVRSISVETVVESENLTVQHTLVELQDLAE